MGIASRTKWARRRNVGGRVRPGKPKSDYRKTLRKQERMVATASPYDLSGQKDLPGE